VAAVCGGLAFLPVRFSPWWRDDTAVAPTHDPIPTHVSGFHVPSFVAVAVVALIVSSTVSARLFADRWTANPARTYATNAERTMKNLEPRDRLYNGVVPTRVVWKLLYPANLPTSMLGPLGLKARPLEEGETTSYLKEFGEDGVLNASHVNGVGTSLFDTVDCLTDVGSTPRELPLTSTIFEWPWILQIDYVAEKPGTLDIVAGSTRSTAVIGVGKKGPGGLQTVYAAVGGGYDSMTLTAPENSFCIKTLAIGSPQPNEW
jgi:hypothetical protein